MKIAYVAGPYRAAEEHRVQENIDTAAAVARALWSLGFACVCPHKNSSHFGGLVPEEQFIQGGIEILRRCDCVVLSQGYKESEGTQREIVAARAAGIPVFTFPAQAERWMKEEEKE